MAEIKLYDIKHNGGSNIFCYLLKTQIHQGAYFKVNLLLVNLR